MKREELQHDFHNEQGINWLNSQGEPDIDYVMWLENKILAIKNNTPLPPAEGAERKPKKKLSAHSFWSWCRKDYKTCMVTSTNEIHFDIEDLWRFMDAFAAQQPAAEGAEEILEGVMVENGFTYVSFPAFVENESSIDVFDIACKAMTEFATLHAQRIADKMVEERLREYHLNEGYDIVMVGNPDKEIDGDIFEDIKVAALELSELRGLKVMITGFYANYLKSRDSHDTIR